jgi:hypothetical protein
MSVSSMTAGEGRLVRILVLAALWLVLGTFAMRGAQKRQIEVAGLSMTDPAAVRTVTVGGSEVQARLALGTCKTQPVTPFDAGDDWIQNIAISVFNRTNKVIAAEEIHLLFPEAGNRIYGIMVGRIPANAAFYSRGRPGAVIPQGPEMQPMAFLPGETRLVHLGDYLGQIRESLEREKPLSAYTRVFISTGAIHFEDGMRWDANVYSVPDPKEPGRWTPQAGSYFPGDKEDNLPPGQRWTPTPCGQ